MKRFASPAVRPSPAARCRRLAGLALAAGCIPALALIPVSADAARKAPRPACDDIALRTEQQNDRWRVVRLPDRSDPSGRASAYPAPILACRRGGTGPAKLVEVGGDSRSGGAREALQLSGDRLLVVGDSGPSSGGGGGTVAVVDLPTRRVLSLGYSGWSANPDFTRRPTVLSSSGGVASATWSGGFSPAEVATDAWIADVVEGPLQLWNGQALAAGTVAVRGLVPVPAPSNAAYAITPAGPTRIVAPRVPTSAFSGTPLSFSNIRLPGRPRARGISRTLLAPQGRYGRETFELVVDRRAKGRVRSWIQASVIGDPDGPRARYPLALGGHRDLRVLAGRGAGVIVAARFAGGDESRRIRLVSVHPTLSASIDLPATPAAELPGHVALFDEAVAIAEAGQIRLFGADTRVIPLEGARDLAFVGAGFDAPIVSSTDPRSLLYTAPDGQVGTVTVAPRE